MGLHDLREHLDLLRRERELVEVAAPCSARLEIAEIHRRVIAAGGPALLFRSVEGSDFPLVTNLFGTRRRVELAFGSRPERLVGGLLDLARELWPPTLAKLWGRKDVLAKLLAFGTTAVGPREAPVLQAERRPPALDRLPLLQGWKEDAGAFFTLGLVQTRHPETGVSNLGIYRMQRFDDRTTGMHWQIQKGGGFHHAEAERRGEPLPVTVLLGGPPALLLAAVAPLPENVPEILLASLLLGGKVPVCEAPGAPHPLVATAEAALVGRVPPRERRPEGPFGDHYGVYSLRHPYPVFHAERLWHRRDAILPGTVVGKPRQEDFFLGDYLQELLSPLFPLVMPGVRNLWSYGETGYHSLAAAVVRERYRREAMTSAFRILGEGQLSLTKFLLVTDRPGDLRDFRTTLETVLARFRPESDLHVFADLSMDTLDYTGPAVNEGSKGVMLGLGDPVRELPRVFAGALPAGARRALPYCGGCLAVDGPSYPDEPGFAERVLDAFPGWPLVVLVDDAAQATRSDARFLWTVFTRFEPAADIHARHRVLRNHVVREGTVVIDARSKPSYPEELRCDPETAALVTGRWGEYFPAGGVEMGDSDVAHLG